MEFARNKEVETKKNEKKKSQENNRKFFFSMDHKITFLNWEMKCGKSLYNK